MLIFIITSSPGVYVVYYSIYLYSNSILYWFLIAARSTKWQPGPHSTDALLWESTHVVFCRHHVWHQRYVVLLFILFASTFTVCLVFICKVLLRICFNSYVTITIKMLDGRFMIQIILSFFLQIFIHSIDKHYDESSYVWLYFIEE